MRSTYQIPIEESCKNASNNCEFQHIDEMKALMPIYLSGSSLQYGGKSNKFPFILLTHLKSFEISLKIFSRDGGFETSFETEKHKPFAWLCPW